MNNKRLFLFDIDGTIALDADWIDGTLDLLEWIQGVGGKAIFITNNSTKSIKDYVTKFHGMGLVTTEDNFLTSSYITGIHLKEHYSDQLIFLVGTESFVTEMKSFGLRVTENLDDIDDISCTVVGFDNHLTFSKIEDICRLLQTKEVDYYGTNPDYVCPTSFGFVPDCGGICEFIELAVKRRPIYLGKPNRNMVDLSMERAGYSKEQTVVVGDRLYTDIACGINAEVDTILVLTGEAKREDLVETEFKPTYVYENVRELYQDIVSKKV